MFENFVHRARYRLTANIDGSLLLITCLLMMIGLATVHSATYDGGDRLFDQALNMAVGLAVMWSVAQVPPQKLMRFAVPLYTLGVALRLG